jgi:hypothetical protein
VVVEVEVETGLQPLVQGVLVVVEQEVHQLTTTEPLEPQILVVEAVVVGVIRLHSKAVTVALA